MLRLTARMFIAATCFTAAFALNAGDLKPYSAPSVGLNLNYPASWKVLPNPDKDTLLKISAAESSGLHCESSVAEMHAIDDEKLAMGLIEQMIRNHSPNYQVISKGDLYIGPKGKLKAYAQTFSLQADQLKLLQKFVAVRSPGSSMVVLSFSYLPSESASIEPLVQTILSTVQFGGKPTSINAAPKTTVKTDDTSLTSFTSKAPSITISYPSNWKIVDTIEAGTLAKFNGHDESGRGGELTVSTMPAPRSNLEDLEPMLDENIFHKLKNYHCVRKESMTFGSPRSITGEMIEGTSDTNGKEARHLTCYCKEQDRYFVVSLWGIGYKPGELHALFSKIANTFRIND